MVKRLGKSLVYQVVAKASRLIPHRLDFDCPMLLGLRCAVSGYELVCFTFALKEYGNAPVFFVTTRQEGELLFDALQPRCPQHSETQPTGIWYRSDQ